MVHMSPMYHTTVFLHPDSRTLFYAAATSHDHDALTTRCLTPVGLPSAKAHIIKLCRDTTSNLIIVQGGPKPLEKEIHEVLVSKRDDRFSNPFFEMVPKTCQGSFFVPALA